jgi:hypothetical protein
MTTSAAGTARSDLPLAAASLVTALVVGPIGYLLFALSERSPDRALGVVLTGAAVLVGVTGAAMLATGTGSRAWSLTLSVALVVLGVVAASVVLTGQAPFVPDALLLALPAIVGGLVTGALALRR